MAKFVSPLDQLRLDWDRMAREDPIGGVCPDLAAGDVAAFVASGRALCEQRIAPAVALVASETPPDARRALDVGCGPGRLLLPLAELFAHVDGVDISPEMLRLAAARIEPAEGGARVALHLGDGMTLQCVRKHRYDFAVASEVLRGLPDRALLVYLVRQIGYRLNPGGVALLQFDAKQWFGKPFDEVEVIRALEDSTLTAIARDRDERDLWVTARKD